MPVEVTLTIPRRSEIARAHKQQGGLIAAVLPIHYSRALLRAFSFLPIEVWGPPNVDASYGAAHLQPYVCSVVRNALSFLKLGGLEIADIIVVPHACDSLQGLGSLLLDFVQPAQPVIPLYLPRGCGPRETNYLAEEFRSVYHRLEGIAHISPSNEELIESIRREEAADRLLSQLHSHRANLGLDDHEFYRLIRAREYLPAEAFSKLAQPILELRHEIRREGIPVLLSGIVPEPMKLLQSISELGGLVIADDLASCGRRLYPPGESEDAFLRMSERILGAPPDWSRGSPIQERLEYLLNMSETSGAKGVIFYTVKFCEPELFDLPDLRKGLQQAGMPSVVIEVDLNDPLSNHVLTRIEAFLEMIV